MKTVILFINILDLQINKGAEVLFLIMIKIENRLFKEQKIPPLVNLSINILTNKAKIINYLCVFHIL